MRRSWNRSLAVLAVGALALAACGDDTADDPAEDTTEESAAADDPAAPEDPDGDLSEEDLEDLLGDQPEMDDPNEDVQDGVYRGNGIVLPVPDGFELDQAAFAQGVVAAISADGTQQLSAQAIDASDTEAAGQELDLDTLLDNVRQLGDAEVDEEIELQGAERAQRLTFLELPAQQEGAPDSSATVVLAEDDRGLVGEFAFGAAAEDYDEALEQLLLDEAGFDPDSEPAAPAMPEPMPEPMPEGDLPEGDGAEDAPLEEPDEG